MTLFFSRRIFFYVFGGGLLIFSVVGISTLYVMNSFLTLDKTVDANVLVIEGWIPDCGLKRAYEEFKTGNYDYIITTGSRLDASITMHVNSYLIFYPNPNWKEKHQESQHIFYLQATSSLGKTDSAGFHFYVNDKKIATFYTTQNNGRFPIPWQGKISEMDSIMIRYHNDKVGPMGDRNLVIERFSLNDHKIDRKSTEMYFDRGRPFGRFRWDAGAISYAEMGQFYFLDRNIDSEIMFPVTNNFSKKRRTHGNGLALKNWLENQNLDVKGMNVVSMDYHSRRTWKTYHQLLKGKTDVGIISAQDCRSYSRKQRFVSLSRESIAYIYYVLLVWPWI